MKSIIQKKKNKFTPLKEAAALIRIPALEAANIILSVPNLSFTKQKLILHPLHQ